MTDDLPYHVLPSYPIILDGGREGFKEQKELQSYVNLSQKSRASKSWQIAGSCLPLHSAKHEICESSAVTCPSLIADAI